MRVHESRHGVTVVAPEGRLVHGDPIGRLRETIQALVRKGSRRIVVDLGKVGSIDSGGLGQLVASYLATTKAGGMMKLANLSNRAHDLLVTTKLDLTFERLETVDAAVASYGN